MRFREYLFTIYASSYLRALPAGHLRTILSLSIIRVRRKNFSFFSFLPILYVNTILSPNTIFPPSIHGPRSSTRARAGHATMRSVSVPSAHYLIYEHHTMTLLRPSKDNLFNEYHLQIILIPSSF